MIVETTIAPGLPVPPAGGYKREFLLNQIAEWKAEQAKSNPQAVKRTRKARTRTGLDTSTIDLGKVAQAAQALTQIDASRADSYETWVEVGMSLSELGAIGLNLWEQWSKQSAKYDPYACGEKWQSFTPGDGVTLATLLFYAEQEQPEAASTPCRACESKAQIVNVQREKIKTLETEVKQLRDRNRFVSEAQGAKEIKSASCRDTIVELKKEIDRIPVEDRKPDGFIPVRPAYMAACANSSASTVNKHLRRLEDQGYIERRITREYNHEAKTFSAQTYIRPLVDLNNPGVLAVPSTHGGYKQLRCINAACGSPNIVDKIERVCLDCNTPQGETIFVPVNIVDDETDMGASGYEEQPSEAVEEAMTFFETADTTIEAENLRPSLENSSCSIYSNDPLDSTDGKESSIAQDASLIASLSTFEPPTTSQRPINSVYRPRNTPREYPPGYAAGLADRLRGVKASGGES